MKILIFGSTFLTANVVNFLLKYSNHDLIGYVPNRKSTVPGKINLMQVKNISSISYDIKLSIQFDRKIKHTGNAFNVHTGLLPDWGGCDILHHTLTEGVKEQGVTFHKMTCDYDYGPIISKITYPVFDDDKVVDLYEKIINITPGFVMTSLALLDNIGLENVNDKCLSTKPRLFTKGSAKVNEKDYLDVKNKLIEYSRINQVKE